MKTRDILNFKATGFVTVHAIIDNEPAKLLGKYNTILPNAKDILAHLITDTSYGPLDIFRITNAGVQLATLNNLIKSFTSPGQANYRGTFDTASFTGPFDGVFLAHPTLGDFSELSITPALTKAANEKILVNWLIQIL